MVCPGVRRNSEVARKDCKKNMADQRVRGEDILFGLVSGFVVDLGYY